MGRSLIWRLPDPKRRTGTVYSEPRKYPRFVTRQKRRALWDSGQSTSRFRQTSLSSGMQVISSAAFGPSTSTTPTGAPSFFPFTATCGRPAGRGRPGFRPRSRRQGGRKRGNQGRGGERRHRGGGGSDGGLHGPCRGLGYRLTWFECSLEQMVLDCGDLGGAAGTAGDLRHAHRHRAAAVVLLRPRGSERVRDRQPARVGAPAGLRPGGLLAPGDSRSRPISAAVRGHGRRRSPTATT